MERKIVHRVEDGMDREDILCTSYQMRNFFRQMGDGFFKNLDVMNYIQHYKAAKMIKKGWKVLDVCCGRSMLLPLIRYHAKGIGEYVGVDISEANIKEAMTRAGYNRKIDHATYYKFPHRWVNCNVAEMTKHISTMNYFDFVVYTSAIEHMHKVDGEQSLTEIFWLMKPGGTMFLSTPRTENGGFNTQYRAHVYEWGLKELYEAIGKAGFTIQNAYGLIPNKEALEKRLKEDKDLASMYDVLKSYVPMEFLMPVLAPAFPQLCKEVLLIVRKP